MLIPSIAQAYGVRHLRGPAARRSTLLQSADGRASLACGTGASASAASFGRCDCLP